MSERKVAAAKVKRQTLIGQQDRIKEFVDTRLKDATMCELEVRLTALERYSKDFDALQLFLEEADSSESEGVFRALFEETYFSLQPSLVTAINERKRGATNHAKDNTILNTSLGGSTVKLPKVTLPTFSGDYTKWMSYYETFSALVDNNDSLDSVTKFHHLRASLSGEALRRIESIEVEEKNYVEALMMLRDRYANNSIIVEEHVKGLLNFPPISKVTANNIRELVDTVTVHLRSLTSLGRPVAHWDDLIICIVLSKLDHITYDKWIDVRSTERLPTLKELFKFLDKRCQQLERKTSQQHHAQPSLALAAPSKVYKVNRTQVPKASLVTTNVQKVCTYCSKPNHNVYRCRKFLALTPKERFIAANKNNLCINCLKNGHNHQNCESDKCRLCQGTHHTLVHEYSISSNPTKPPATPVDLSSSKD